jgi:murein L,D-transpeptidase YcbB/YkuD
MRGYAISLLLGALLAAPAGAPLAQDRAEAAGPESARVVIAPPQTELARIIKSGLATAYQAASRGSRAYERSQQLYYFYGARHFEPLWLSEQANGDVAFSPNAEKIIEIFKASALEGFRPSDYLTADLDVAAAGTNPRKLAALETAFSAAAVRYAQDAHGGRVAPQDVSSLWTLERKRIDEADLLMRLAASETPDRILRDLSPKHREFVQLRTALARFYDGSVIDAAVTIPDGPTLRAGMQDERVSLLRQRLDVPEPEIFETAGATAAPDITYDETLVAAVTAFQERLGLTADGIAGPATVAALNGGSATTKEDIVANMERWRWLPEDLGFHVAVNIPEFRLEIIDRDRATYTTRVVVGTAKNQTPVFSDEIEHIVVNPYWNVPVSIARNEIGPRLVSNPGYLAGQNMELLYGGKLVNAAAVDWTSYSIRDFRVRQRPGASNALGRIKFLFPNQHDVYLHDTPSKSLFQRSFRAYSHGCIRVQNPMEFADALLANEPNLDVASLESMLGSTERWNNVDTHIPVHISYFTLRVDEDGTIRSYADVYGLNGRMIELLNQ